MQTLEELLTQCRRFNYGVNITFNPIGLRDTAATVAVAFFSLGKKSSKPCPYSCQTGHDILEVASRAWSGLDEPPKENSRARVSSPNLTSLLSELDL